MEDKKQHKKLLIVILIDTMIIAALVIYFGIIRPPPSIKINGILIENPQDIPEFHFVDNHARAFTKENLKGHWTFLYFGFTQCEMICPVTMAKLTKMYEILQKDLPISQLPQIVFISIDPNRDTIDKINRFVSAFNPHFIGARADVAETISLEKQLHITSSKREGKYPENDYIIDHSMDILLLNPAAKVQVYFPYPHQPEQMAKDFKLILNSLEAKFATSMEAGS